MLTFWVTGKIAEIMERASDPIILEILPVESLVIRRSGAETEKQ